MGNEVYKVVITPGLTFVQAIRIATPVRCLLDGASIWDVLRGIEIPPSSVVPSEGGEFQVSLKPVAYEFAPYGVVSFPPLTTVAECLHVLNGLWFAQKASLLLTANGKLVEPTLAIGLADFRGPLWVKIYGLKGGAKADTPVELSNKLQSLLIEKGVPKQVTDERTHSVYQGLGTRTLRQVFASKDLWSALKVEASKERSILVGNLEKNQTKDDSKRKGGSGSVDDLPDAWQEWLDRRGKIRARSKESSAVTETPAFQLDVNFFRT